MRKERPVSMNVSGYHYGAGGDVGNILGSL